MLCDYWSRIPVVVDVLWLLLTPNSSECVSQRLPRPEKASAAAHEAAAEEAAGREPAATPGRRPPHRVFSTGLGRDEMSRIRGAGDEMGSGVIRGVIVRTQWVPVPAIATLVVSEEIAEAGTKLRQSGEKETSEKDL